MINNGKRNVQDRLSHGDGALKKPRKSPEKANPPSKRDPGSSAAAQWGKFGFVRAAPAPPKEPEPEVAQQQAEKSSEASKHFVLSNFSRGNPVNPKFHDLHENQVRHQQFTALVGQPKYRKPQARNLTPYQSQYIELKRKYMDAIVIMKIGYKHQILARDAQIAAPLLGLSLVRGWMHLDEGDPIDALYSDFARVSFPAHAHILADRIRKLLNAGHKVVQVNQTETSALKSVGANKRGPFRREVANVYTKGTYINDLNTTTRDEDSSAAWATHIAALVERPNRGGNDYGFISVDPTTGEIIYDQFSDLALATELETRLLHVQPSEILLVGEVSRTARKVVDTLLARSAASRLEVVDPLPQLKLDEILTRFPRAQKLDSLVQVSAAALIRYLTEFNLAEVFSLNTYVPFAAATNMTLNSHTLMSLEIFMNATNFGPEGTLFSIMDHTRTAFGKRLFRTWISKPLLDRELLTERVGATEELISGYCQALDRLKVILSKLPDVERSLLQIHYRRIGRTQLYYTLYYLSQAANSFTVPQIRAENLKSPLLRELLEKIPESREFIDSKLRRINAASVKKGGDSADYFVEEDEIVYDSPPFAELADYNLQVQMTYEKFGEYLKEVQKKTNIDIKYTVIADKEYLLEVKKAARKEVPDTWRRVSDTKDASRYQSPETVQLMKELSLAKERREIALEAAFKHFVDEIAEHFEELKELVVALANIDCLMSLASLASNPDYTKVDYVDTPCIEITAGRNPIVDELLVDGSSIPNDIKMYDETNRVMIITGPNMGGKSSLVRQVALTSIMAQVGSFVPAQQARLSLLDGIYIRMGAGDNLMRGESTFNVELKECSEILSRATPRSLIVLDELGRGTSISDGTAIAQAVVRYITTDIRCFTLFITHYPLVTELEKEFQKVIGNWSMDYIKDDETKLLTFTYKVTQKPAYRSFGLNVARLANLSEDILAAAEAKSLEFERSVNFRKAANLLAKNVSNAIKSGDEEALSTVLDIINQ